MSVLGWIVLAGLLMSAIALVGGLTLLLSERTLRRLTLTLVAFAAGSLIGGALFHMLPAALERPGDPLIVLVWVAAGFLGFFVVEQFLHYHHCQRAGADCRAPLTYLILIGDGVHNFLGGLAVAGVFLVDVRLGITAWVAAAAHEVPQELGEYGVLIHGGWGRRSALLFNFLSALMFLVGGLVAYFASFTVDVSFLVPLAAGNFLYLGATDLVPEIRRHDQAIRNVEHFVAFTAGLGLLLLLAIGGG